MYLAYLHMFIPKSRMSVYTQKVKVFDVRMRKLQQLYSSHDDSVTQVGEQLREFP